MKAPKTVAVLVALLMLSGVIAKPAEAGSDWPWVGLPLFVAAAVVVLVLVDKKGGIDADDKKPSSWPEKRSSLHDDGWLPKVARSLPCGAGNGDTIPLACW
jgi:hypothetical protein